MGKKLKEDEKRVQWMNKFPTLIETIKDIADKYGIDPAILAYRLGHEGWADAQIKNKSTEKDLFNNEMSYIQGHNIFGLDFTGGLIELGKIQPLIDKSKYTIWDDSNEKQIDRPAGAFNLKDNMHLMASTMKYLLDIASKDFPNATKNQLNKATLAYYNRGQFAGKKYINSKGITSNFGYDPYEYEDLFYTPLPIDLSLVSPIQNNAPGFDMPTIQPLFANGGHLFDGESEDTLQLNDATYVAPIRVPKLGELKVITGGLPLGSAGQVIGLALVNTSDYIPFVQLLKGLGYYLLTPLPTDEELKLINLLKHEEAIKRSQEHPYASAAIAGILGLLDGMSAGIWTYNTDITDPIIMSLAKQLNIVGPDGKIFNSTVPYKPENYYRFVSKPAIDDANMSGVIKASGLNRHKGPSFGYNYGSVRAPFKEVLAREADRANSRYIIEGTPESANWVDSWTYSSRRPFIEDRIKNLLKIPLKYWEEAYPEVSTGIAEEITPLAKAFWEELYTNEGIRPARLPLLSSQALKYLDAAKLSKLPWLMEYDSEAFPMTNGDVNATPSSNFVYYQKYPIIGWRQHLFKADGGFINSLLDLEQSNIHYLKHTNSLPEVRYDNGGILFDEGGKKGIFDPSRIIQDVPAREWAAYELDADGKVIDEGYGTSGPIDALYHYFANKGKKYGDYNLKLALDILAERKLGDKEDALNYINHAAAMRQFYGFDNLEAIEESPNKPSNSKDLNAKYYRFKNMVDPQYHRDVLEDMAYEPVGSSKHYTDGTLNEFTAYKGKDDKGEFVSYYDIWDYNPTVIGGPRNMDSIISNSTGGKPFEIYDKIYYDDYHNLNSEGANWLPSVTITPENTFVGIPNNKEIEEQEENRRYSKGGKLEYDKLSIRDKAAIIKLYVSLGYRDIASIRDAYNQSILV